MLVKIINDKDNKLVRHVPEKDLPNYLKSGWLLGSHVSSEMISILNFKKPTINVKENQSGTGTGSTITRTDGTDNSTRPVEYPIYGSNTTTNTSDDAAAYRAGKKGSGGDNNRGSTTDSGKKRGRPASKSKKH